MNKIFLEYIWLDGYADQNVRSKTKVVTIPPIKDEDNIEIPMPDWSFDGSSTNQAEGEYNTDCILKPVFSCPDPFRGGLHKLVFCEVYEVDEDGDVHPHPTNARRKLAELVEELGFTQLTKKDVPWFGWEQEYTLTKKKKPFAKDEEAEEKPLGHEDTEPRGQGEYYCAVGSDNVIGRNIAERHMELCLAVGLELSGINAEVMLGQWEYQIGPVGALGGSDQLWVSRYILHRVAENYGVKVSFHPKPLTGDWNGSGCHVNFSTKEMREEGGVKAIREGIDKLSERHQEHMAVYGNDNEKRMSGEHETSSYDKFDFGLSTRNTSIRIPVETSNNQKGYFEDRRPASNCDPYKVAHIMLETIYNKNLIER
jgi:glutamine synthetase